MQFVITDKAPVRYEAVPGAWVEHARPAEMKVGEAAVYVAPEAKGGARFVWASVFSHAGSGAYAVELVVNGWAESDFEERVFKARLPFERAKALLLRHLAAGLGCS